MKYRKYFFLILITTLSIFLCGYDYGIRDNALFIPFIKKYFDTNMYPGDLVLSTKPFFTWIFIPLIAKVVSILDIQLTLFFLFVFSKFLLFSMVWKISYLLFKDIRVTYLSITFFVLPQISLASRSLDSVFILSDLTFAILLFALYYILLERYTIACLIIGLTLFLHPLYSVYLIFIIFLYFISNYQIININVQFRSYVIILLTFIPYFILMNNLSGETTSYIFMPIDWLEILKIRSSKHMFPFSWGIFTWANFILTVILFTISINSKPKMTHHKIVMTIVGGIFLLCLAGIIFTEFVPILQFLQLQAFRSTQYFTVISFIYFSNYCFRFFDLSENGIIRKILLLLFLLLLIGSYPIKTTFYSWLAADKKTLIYQPLIINLDTKNSDWKDTQLWIKSNTSKNSIIIVPPYLEGFRIDSERSILGSWKDGTMSNFSHDIAIKWWERMTDLECYSKECKPNYSNLSEDKIKSISIKYNANYIIFEKDKYLPMSQVFANNSFVVYRI